MDNVDDHVQQKFKLATQDYRTGSKEQATCDSHRCQTGSVIELIIQCKFLSM